MRRTLSRVFVAAAAALALFPSLLSACTDGGGPSSAAQTPAASPAQSVNETLKPVQSADSGSEPGSNPEPSVQLPAAKAPGNNVKVKALYLTGWTVGSAEKVRHYVELANSTEINSYVIDIKDESGLVAYESSVPLAKEIKGWDARYEPEKVIGAFHDSGIRVIGRIVCFKDPYLSIKKPELAIKTTGGGLFRDGNMKAWLNPRNRDSWPYLVALAREAAEKGFDEIQFDYVRFPSDGDTKAIDYGDESRPKYEVIDEFLAYARRELPGVVLSADIFGIVCVSPADTEDIGQNLEYIGRSVDYISPMVYPSHYALGQIVNDVKFLRPDLEPYGVVFNTLMKAKERISKVEGYGAVVRPYLQDFTASWLGKGNYQSYGAEQVRLQIKAVYDAGYDEWIFWNAGNDYSESAFAKKK